MMEGDQGGPHRDGEDQILHPAIPVTIGLASQTPDSL